MKYLKLDSCLTLTNIARLTALISLFTLIFAVYANRVDDFDLWWHLKSGQKIVQDMELPDQDSFAFTTVTPVKVKDLGQAGSGFKHWDVNLTQSWLGQVIFYLVFMLAGLKGIGLLKSSIFVATYLILYLAMLRRRANPIISFLVIALTALIGLDFNYSRIQLFSFPLFALLIYIFADFKRAGKSFYFLPLILLLWANIHGGYILGAATILLFTGAIVLQDLAHKRLGWPASPTPLPGRVKALVIVTGLALLASLINPNGYFAYLMPLAVKQSVFSSIEEYVRPMLYEYHSYWLLILLVTSCAILRLKHLAGPEFLLVVFWLIASQTGIRAIIFFALASTVFVAGSLTDIGAWLAENKSLVRLRERMPPRVSLPPGSQWAILAVLSLGLLGQNVASGNYFKFEIEEHTYPAAAVEFIQKQKLPGKMFNPYNWGGYLIWYLPEYPVFIDGRCLNEKAYVHSGLIMSAAGENQQLPEGKPLWQYLLDAYGVQFILTNGVSGGGNLIPLVSELVFEPNWHLIYTDGKALLFLRDSEENRSRYGHLFLEKEREVLNEIVSECRAGIERTPTTWEYYATLGGVYFKRREIKQAREMFEKYLTMNPQNSFVVDKLNFIRRMSGENPVSPLNSPHNW